jgi:hypothetical protein
MGILYYSLCLNPREIFGVEVLNLMIMENIKEIDRERGREWRLGFSSGSAM